MLMCINNAQFMGSATNGHFCSICRRRNYNAPAANNDLTIMEFYALVSHFSSNQAPFENIHNFVKSHNWNVKLGYNQLILDP